MDRHLVDNILYIPTQRKLYEPREILIIQR